MTLDDLKRIEDTLEIELPEAYKAFVLNYPAVLREGNSPTSEFDFLESANDVIELNQRLRNGGDLDWPEEYLAIGESGCGDYYAIDTDESNPDVLCWNHEIGDFEESEEPRSIVEFAGSSIKLRKLLASQRR